MGAHSGDIILAWLIGGVLALCGALCYGELGANMPESGGEYYYISRLIHPSLGFLSGWISLIVGFSAPIAAAAMAMNIYFAQVFPGWPVQFMAVLTIALFSLLHAYDLRIGASVQVVLVLLKILLILGFVAGVFITGKGNGVSVLKDFNPDFWFTSAFAVILIFVAFAYSGWNAASYIGAEIKGANRNLPLALIIGTTTVTAIYMMVNYAFLSTVSLEQISGVESIGHVVAASLWGPVGGDVVSALIGVGLVSTVSAMIIIGPRVYEAMARDRLLFPSLAKLNRHGVPSLAVGLQAVIAIIIALTSTFGSLLIYIGFTLNIFAAITVLSLLRLRRQGHSSIQACWGYPVTPIVFLIFTIWMTIWSIQSKPVSTLMGLGTLAIGYIVYLVQSRKRQEI
jgi:APA family basic amino acid/polyamine antiporter